MPLIMDGVTIPENVANALNYNGTNITSVIFNGTTVWTQNLGVLNNGWSGSTMIDAGSGIETSGFSYRFAIGGIYSSWSSVSNMAIFGSTSSIPFKGDNFWIEGSGNSLRIRSASQAPGFVTFNTSTKTFTSSSSIRVWTYNYFYNGSWYGNYLVDWSLQISGNSIRIVESYSGTLSEGQASNYGGWISLT